MAFFNSAVGVLQTLVIALGAGLGIWGVINLLEGYAKAARTAKAAGSTAQATAKSAEKTAEATATAAKKAAEKAKEAAEFVARHWKGVLVVLAGFLLIVMLIGGLQSCSALVGAAGGGVAASSYQSEDADILAAEAAYCALEAELQEYLDTYERTHDYDEYHYDLDEIKHDPYVLASILSALHDGAWTASEVQGTLQMLFEKQYILTETVVTEVRYRTVTRTDSEGNEYEVEVPYNYYICTVELENFDLSHIPVYIMDEETLSKYALYMSVLGNKPELFGDSEYIPKYITNRPEGYEIPPSAMEDETFAAVITEAEKYLGYPYVWGGSSPSTSFDCSGFVSWVLTNSGVCNTGRLGAQGLYNISTPVSNPKPGDLVFFVGTYDTPGVSHVGIYVGNSMMIHCGDPISYSNLNSSYAVVLSGMESGKVKGSIYELDYATKAELAIQTALRTDNNRLIYEKGSRELPKEYRFEATPDREYGKFVRYEAVPHDPDALRDLLRDESRKRERLKPGNFREHIGRLSDEKVLAEAQRLSAAFQSLQAPNSPNGTHFVVEVSPWFERIASSKEHERLFALLPYKTLYLSSVKDRHGVFAFISKDERRDLPLRKQRPSVRAQLKEGQSKKTAAPKKAAAKTKDNDLEV